MMGNYLNIVEFIIILIYRSKFFKGNEDYFVIFWQLRLISNYVL